MKKVIVHISDIHFGTEDLSVLNSLIEKIEVLKPALLIFSGDLTQRAKTDEFIRARAFIDKLNVPVIVVPGNHDVPMYNVFKRFFNPLKKYTRYISADLYPFYQDEQAAVLGLNTARSMTIKGGRINNDQIEVILNRMSGLPSDLLKILVTHHPFDVPEGKNEDDIVQNAENAMKAIDLSGIDVLLAGHLHLSNISKSTRRYKTDSGREVLIIQAGTAASSRVRDEVNSFNLLEFEDPRLTVSRFENPGNPADFQLAESMYFTRTEKGWKKA